MRCKARNDAQGTVRTYASLQCYWEDMKQKGSLENREGSMRKEGINNPIGHQKEV